MSYVFDSFFPNVVVLYFQSHWACDVFTFLPTVYFSTPGYDYCLLGKYSCVSFYVTIIVLS